MALDSLVFGAIGVLFTVLLVVAMMKAGRFIVTKSGMVLPGTRTNRLVVMLVALAAAIAFMIGPDMSNGELGIFVLIGGLMVIFAYKLDDAVEAID